MPGERSLNGVIPVRAGCSETDNWALGMANERRAFSLMGQLVDEGHLLKARRASRKQDFKGIDFFCYVQVGDDVEMLAYQIKSSARAAVEFRRTHRSYLEKHQINVVVVNQFRSDDEIKRDIIIQGKSSVRRTRQAGMAEVVNARV